MTVAQRLQAFEKLYQALLQLGEADRQHWARLAKSHNGWFEYESVSNAIDGLIRYLEPISFRQWATAYDLKDETVPQKVGVIMAGNIPMVGIHDLLCVLMSGHELHAKLSSQDPALIKEVTKLLIQVEPTFESRIHFVERMNTVDAFIATGSDNSARYFDYYFKDKPKIIRKNRTAVAVLTGEENEKTLADLAEDITTYYGLGCRNVSKVFVPKGYELTKIMKATESATQNLLNKYNNNYDYNKSIYLVNQEAHLDNGGMVLAENESLVSPISVLFYEYYESLEELSQTLGSLEEKIQCVVSDVTSLPQVIPFGQAQRPDIHNYADGVDTMAFLVNLPS